MQRCRLKDSEIDRVRELTNDAGLSLRLHVDIDGEASFGATGLGSFDDLLAYERALADLARAQG